MQKAPDSTVQISNTAKVLALIQAARTMDIAELCKRGDYNQPNARYPQTKSERIVDELLSLMLQDSTVELDPALDEMLSILSSLDKGVDKPKDWRALFAIADEIETRKTNQQDIKINSSNSQYPQMTYKQAVKHCKYWADQIRADGLDLLTTDYGAAIGVSDQLAYPLEMQAWINSQEHPLLYKVCVYAVTVDNDHTDRESWKKLLELIDKL